MFSIILSVVFIKFQWLVCFSDWQSVQQHIKDHPDFTQYFYECPDDLPWTEGDFDDPSETRIPFDVLDTTEAETVFKNHVNALQQEQKRLE